MAGTFQFTMHTSGFGKVLLNTKEGSTQHQEGRVDSPQPQTFSEPIRLVPGAADGGIEGVVGYCLMWSQDEAQGRFHLAEQNHLNEVQDLVQDRQATMNKVGIVPPRTKSPTDESHGRPGGSRLNGSRPGGAPRERPKSAVFPVELKSKMSVEEQNERIRRNQSSSARDKRRSLNLSAGQSPANYRVVGDAVRDTASRGRLSQRPRGGT
ncbi:Pleckstrin y domain-containing family A member 6 [Liparis tanakae]|uniref:Pleckstrin y domain-containing family A member 6 n=1 Tax=Liparis tanakae TaxID=230148 RepID=A0A4Z2EJH2_9TELE|nr:Pleckstrin y domain-containing family A member 6 [Liparis tanakae]